MELKAQGRPEAGRVLDILLVDDSAKDVRLLREVLKECSIEYRLRVASDGHKALSLLRRQGAHAEEGLPNLVLLDINLPILTGIEVLAAIKADPDLATLPVLMLTTSRADSDVLACYRLHANSYLVKPLDFDQFIRMMSSVHEFWLNQSELPPPVPGACH